MKLAGIVLIVLGVLAIVYQGFTYTQTKKDAQLGPIEIQHQETHSVPIPAHRRWHLYRGRCAGACGRATDDPIRVHEVHDI